MKPTINITLPFYNRADLMAQAINNALNIDYIPKTITVINDGSSEPVDETIEEFKGTPGLTYLKLNQNVGADTARNVSLLVSRYDYITFHDSDDLYDKRKLRRQMDKLIETESLVVFCKFIHVDIDQQFFIRGDRISLLRDFYPNVVREKFQSYILFNPGLYSKDVFVALGGYYPGHFGGDDDLQNRVVASGMLTSFVDEPLILKLDRLDSVTINPKTGFKSRQATGFYNRLHKDIEKYRTDPRQATIPIDLPASLEVTAVFAAADNQPTFNAGIPCTLQTQKVLKTIS